MGSGKTFTNAIIREIGRNYGKAISNQLMGNSHSTPVRVSGNRSTSSRVKYQSKLDEHLQKFSIQGKIATFNQAQNIHLEFFNLVEEINSDGKVDVNEFSQICDYLPRVIRTLDNIIKALIELEEPKVEIVKEKKVDILDFRDSIVSSFEEVISNGTSSLNNKTIRNRGLLLSLVSLDRIYFYPKQWKSYLPFIILLLTLYKLSTSGGRLDQYFLLLLSNILVYSIIWNPISKGGVWKYIKSNKNSKELYTKLDKMLEELRSI